MISIYIHIPFCLSKCPYCDFYSVKFDEALAKAYTIAVLRALDHSAFKDKAVDTVYFGGGTPNLLGADNLTAILAAIDRNFDMISPEITLELNPAAARDRRPDDLPRLKSAGFNRVSFGVQSAIDTELKSLGRLHDSETARQSILAARDAGFENISADLMLGIPYQTRESLKQSIDFLAALPLSHISAYMLKIEETTPFAAQKKSELCPDEDLLAEMYLDCVDMLSRYGFKQYEISNFAKNGTESAHNLKYWKLGEYLGIGPAAHSFINGKRFYFPRDLDAFINAENPLAHTVPDGGGGDFEEYAMLRLRLREGLNLSEASKIYGIDASLILKKAQPLEQGNLAEISNDTISLTPQGFLLSNMVTAKLLY